MADVLNKEGKVLYRKTPLYTVGNVDPVGFSSDKNKNNFDLSRTYSTWAGVDYNVYFDGKACPNLQAISWVATPKGVYAGTIITLAFSSHVEDWWFDGEIHNITLKAVNEYGAGMELNLGDVVVERTGSGISIDDLVTERQYTYRGATIFDRIRRRIKEFLQ
jgi:hypothetical protein